MLNLLQHAFLLLLAATRLSAHLQTPDGAGTLPLESDGGAGDTAAIATGAGEQAVALSSSSAVEVSRYVGGNATCQSKTANYITHTLPQQCLRTGRTSSVTNGTVVVPQMSRSSAAKSSSATTQQHSETAPRSTALLETIEPSTLPSSNERSVVVSFTSVEQAAPSESANTPPTATTTITETTGTSSTTSEIETETGSPLDNANFLSFEDWKKQNLAKAGQSPENVGQARAAQLGENRKRPGINNALDTLGEDAEIELDFSGFGAAGSSSSAPSSHSQASDPPSAEQTAPASPSLRSKDAGKTCKERTNYASFDCAATVLKTNPESKSASSILVENKDSYMLNKCSADNKFMIIELCNDILIDTIVLANYEFFSSIFRTFRLSVSDRYPVKMERWKVLGTFEARNTREVQAFLVEEPQIWARYLRVEFLTHYGSEYYCPVSLLRVHGTTMMEEFRSQEDAARGENLDEEIEAEVSATGTMAQKPTSHTDEATVETVQAVSDTKEALEHANETEKAEETQKLASLDIPQTTQETSPNWWTSSVYSGLVAKPTSMTCEPTAAPHAISQTSASDTASSSEVSATTDLQGNQSALAPFSNGTEPAAGRSASPTDSSSATSVLAGAPTASDSSSQVSISSTSSDPVENMAGRPMDTMSATPSSVLGQKSNEPSNGAPSSKPAEVSEKSHVASSSTAKQATSTSLAAHAQPSTQESFFKSVHKRLQQLEANSTLSLQYIEAQSLILRDAFSKVEKRQLEKTSSFLETLNTTVMSELHGFRQAYDQLWQSTVIELEGHRERYEREMFALSARLTLVADELVWQKRMAIVQSTLLLLCIGLVLFARSGSGYLELPLVQQMVHRSQTALKHASYYSPPRSPSPDTQSPVGVRIRRAWRRSTQSMGGHTSDGSLERPESKEGPELLFEPPTPTSQDGQSDAEEALKSVEHAAAGEEESIGVKEIQSGPATPSGTRDGLQRPLSWTDENSRPQSPLRIP